MSKISNITRHAVTELVREKCVEDKDDERNRFLIAYADISSNETVLEGIVEACVVTATSWVDSQMTDKPVRERYELIEREFLKWLDIMRKHEIEKHG